MYVPQCFLCSSSAAAMVFAVHGCTCSDEQVQPRCAQHLARLRDTDTDYEIVEEYPMLELYKRGIRMGMVR
jgi:hypothetical protein